MLYEVITQTPGIFCRVVSVFIRNPAVHDLMTDDGNEQCGNGGNKFDQIECIQNYGLLVNGMVVGIVFDALFNGTVKILFLLQIGRRFTHAIPADLPVVVHSYNFV